MPFRSVDGIRYFYFHSLAAAGIVHGVFTRQGGLSPAPWQSLNGGLQVGDEPERVAANTRLALAALGRPEDSVRALRQVHGAEVAAEGGELFVEPLPEGDGLVSDRPQRTLSMRYADCVPLLLADTHKRAVGIGHAGWRGTVARIGGRMVEKMTELYGSRPADLIAGIGPAICADHYEIGPEVAEQVEAAFGPESRQVLRRRDGRTFFDLWLANRLVLFQAGVARIEVAGLCTADHLADWYSHRAENGRTGRFLAMIASG